MQVLSLRPEAERARRRSLVDVTLDAQQRAAVTLPAGGALLVLGEAGHGKTVVALHRLAHLYKTATTRFRAVMIVPHVGLERWLQPLVTSLGADVEVLCYEHWARRQARAAFGDLPARLSVTTHTGIARLKRARELEPLLQALAELPPQRIDDDYDAKAPKTKASAWRGDLQHLFGDGDRMRWLAAQIGASDSAVSALLEHTHVQFLERAEAQYAHVDAERLVSVDARSLDDDTSFENANSIDSEDFAVLFELDRLRARRLGERPRRPRPYDCIVLDEAQEFAPLELALIGRSLTRDGTLVVAGDAEQQTDPHAAFRSWTSTMHALRVPRWDALTLDIGYRCPPRVTALASALRRGETAPASVPCRSFADEAALYAWLIAEAEPIIEHDPAASFCVVLRTTAAARRMAAALRGKLPCKLVLNGAFSHHRGIDVSTLADVKGLELDYVVIADADSTQYPLASDARRSLYVAATRARYELALACVGALTPLLENHGHGVAS